MPLQAASRAVPAAGKGRSVVPCGVTEPQPGRPLGPAPAARPAPARPPAPHRVQPEAVLLQRRLRPPLAARLAVVTIAVA